MTKNKKEEKLFFSETYEFLEIYLPKQCGKSQCTIKNYRDSLTQFRRYLLDQLGISIGKFSFVQCTREIVMGFLDFITSKGCANSTRNQRLSAIKSYLAFVADKDLSLSSIELSIKKIKQIRTPEPLRPYMSAESVAAILSQPDVTTLKGVRDCTLLVLFYDSALRLSELLNLRIGNVSIDGENSHLRIIGKGAKERVVAISKNASDHLERYFKLFRGMATKNTDLVFYTFTKGRASAISARHVQRLVQQYADMARENCPEIPTKVYPHMFRRTRATHLYQNGVALPLVSRYLGHSSIDVTKVYATPSKEMMREIISSAEHSLTASEEPIWISEDEMAKNCGIR